MSCDVYPFKVGEFYGVVSLLGEVVVKPRYHILTEFNESLATAMRRDFTNCIVDSVGNEQCIDCDVEYLGEVSCGRMFAQNAEYLTGFLDTTGKLVVPFEYNYSSSFAFGLAAVGKNRKWGVIDVDGNLVVDCQYGRLSAFNEYGCIGAKTLDSGWFHLDLNCQMNLIEDVDFVCEPLDGYCALIGAYGMKLLQIKGMNRSEPLPFIEYGGYSSGLFCLKDRQGWSFVDKNWRRVLGRFYGARKFMSDLAPVATFDTRKWGAINTKGEWVIPPEYEGVEHIDNKVLVAWKGDESKLFRIDGTTVI